MNEDLEKDFMLSWKDFLLKVDSKLFGCSVINS